MVSIPSRNRINIESMASLLKGMRLRRESHSKLLQQFIIKLLNLKLIFKWGDKKEKRPNS